MNQSEFEARRCSGPQACMSTGKHFVTSNCDSSLRILFNFSLTLKPQNKNNTTNESKISRVSLVKGFRKLSRPGVPCNVKVFRLYGLSSAGSKRGRGRSSRRLDKVGGGGGSSKIFFPSLRASVWSKNKLGAGPRRPLPLICLCSVF